MSEMPVFGTSESDSITDVPEIKGYAYVKGLVIPKYKESYVVVQDGALIAYKDNSLQGVLVTFPLAPWRFKEGVTVEKKDMCKHADHVLQIFQGQDTFFMAFPTADQFTVWENHMKLTIDVISPIVFGIPLKLAFHKGGATKAPLVITKLMDVIEKVSQIIHVQHYIDFIFYLIFSDFYPILSNFLSYFMNLLCFYFMNTVINTKEFGI